MQPNDGQSPFGGISDICIVGVLPGGVRRWGTVGQHLFDGVVAGTTIKLDVADVGYLTETEVGILGLQIHALADAWDRQRTMVILLLLLGRAQEARHPKGASKVSAVRRSVLSATPVSCARSGSEESQIM